MCTSRYGAEYARFVFTLPEPLARCLLRHAGIDEPVWITLGACKLRYVTSFELFL
jgi:hypothetical protein